MPRMTQNWTKVDGSETDALKTYERKPICPEQSLALPTALLSELEFSARTATRIGRKIYDLSAYHL